MLRLMVLKLFILLPLVVGCNTSDFSQRLEDSGLLDEGSRLSLGNDQSIRLPRNSITIDPIVTGVNTSVVGYQWQKLSGPSTGSHSSLISKSITLSNLVEGDYVYRLTVVDADGRELSDSITISVLPSPVPAIVNFSMIQANTDVDRGVITEGETIAVEDIGNTHKLSIRANLAASFAGKVRFELSGQSTINVERVGPVFALFGHNPETDDYSFGSGLYPGAYQLKATPFIVLDGETIEGETEVLNFKLSENGVVPGEEVVFTSIHANGVVATEVDVNGEEYTGNQSALKSYSVMKSQYGNIYRFEVREGDQKASDTPGQNERSELGHRTRKDYGQDNWVAFSFKMEAGDVPNASWISIGQLKGDNSSSPPLAIEAQNDIIRLRSRHNTNKTVEYDVPLVREKWYNVVIHARFGLSNNAILEVWIDGVKVINKSNFNMGYSTDSQTYWKFGLYRESDPAVQAIQFANMEISSTSLATRASSPKPIQP